MDKKTQETLTQWINKETNQPKEKQKLLRQVKDNLGFSPLTSQIVALGVFDVERDQGVVYYQPHKSKNKTKELVEENIRFKPVSEKDMLEQFWEGAKKYDTFVTFNGRSFDIPFILVRSTIHQIKPTKNLMSNRYLNSQFSNAKHIDLLDQLTFYGAVRQKGSLHLWTRAFGIDSPKEDINGDQVAPFFKKGKCLDIARYNGRDILATKDLYLRWRDYLAI